MVLSVSTGLLCAHQRIVLGTHQTCVSTICTAVPPLEHTVTCLAVPADHDVVLRAGLKPWTRDFSCKHCSKTSRNRTACTTRNVLGDSGTARSLGAHGHIRHSTPSRGYVPIGPHCTPSRAAGVRGNSSSPSIRCMGLKVSCYGAALGADGVSVDVHGPTASCRSIDSVAYRSASALSYGVRINGQSTASSPSGSSRYTRSAVSRRV